MENATFPNDYSVYNNTEDTAYIESKFLLTMRIFTITFLSLCFLLGITGNGLVIWIAGFKMEKTVTIVWFLNLAIADFVFNLLVPLLITQKVTDGHWPFGYVMCKVALTIYFLNMTVSTSFLTIISVDRCTSVMCPVWSKNHKSPRLALTISAITWLICFILTLPYLATTTIYHDSDYDISYCISLYSEDHDTAIMMHQTMTILRPVSMFLIPFPIIVTCYCLIVYRLRRSRSLSGSNRPLKVIFTIVLCFFCLWFPYHLWSLLQVLGIRWNPIMYPIMYSLIYCTGSLNSCVNPIVYVFVGRDFKKCLSRSIPFLLEDTFKEKDGSNKDHGINQNHQDVMETEIESYNK